MSAKRGTGGFPLGAGILVLLLVLTVAWISGNHLAFQLFYVLLALGLVSWLWAREVANKLVLRRLELEDGQEVAAQAATTRMMFVGETVTERHQLDNRSRLPAVWVEVDDHSPTGGVRLARAFSLRGRRYKRWTLERRFDRRGVYQVGPVTVRVGDPFGFLTRQQVASPVETIVVYPRLADLGQLAFGAANSPGQIPHRGMAIDYPPDASGIREYDESDSAGRIHWPSSLRANRLMVKNFEMQQGADLWILLDLQATAHHGSGESSTLEYAVSLAGSLAQRALREHRAVGLMSNDSRSTVLAPQRGLTQLTRVLDFLAVCRSDGTAPLERLLQAARPLLRRDAVVAVITASPEENWVPTLADLTRHDRRNLGFRVYAPGEAVRAGTRAAMQAHCQLFPVQGQGGPQMLWTVVSDDAA